MNRSRQIDSASREAIRARLDANILVEAGAGSGKTQMLAERMAAGIALGVYAIEHMAAVTFTRKAASELRGRLHLALEARLMAAGAKRAGAVAEVTRLEAALSNLERFFAGTIHSFCARLLHERPVESHVAPGFTELDEVQDLDLRQRVWREFVTAARRAGDPDVVALLDADIRPADLDDAFAKVCDNEDVTFEPGEGQAPDPAPAAKSLAEFWKTITVLMPATIAEDQKCGMLEAAMAFKRRWNVSRGRLHRASVVAELLTHWDRESKLTMKWWSDDRRTQQRIRDEILSAHQQFVEDVVTPYLSAWRQYVYRLAIHLLTRARHAAAEERRRLNVLNYGDLLNLTARVLRENSDVRRALQQKYQYLLVDEFQDTDPVQAEIAFWLAEDPTGAWPAGADRLDWRLVPLRPGSLFVVGDPKQSIYRFRRADIDIYNIVRERFSGAAGASVVPLTLNFRSGTALCEWANDVFHQTFPAAPTTYAPAFARLDPHEHATTGEVCRFTYDCEKHWEIQPLDAARIAAYIRSEVDAGRRHYADFLILTRKKAGRIEPYAVALEALNIPLEASGAGAFGSSTEVATITRLLRALADPQDQVALVAVLRGPLFGVSDAELFTFKQADGWFSIFHEDDEGTDAAPTDRVQTALVTLRRWFRWTRILPTAGALERIVEDSGYLAMAATGPAGVDAGDLLHAVDRVRAVVEQGGTLSEAADALEADQEATSEVESLPLEPGRSDVVRVMNLHKAKGLEADVVFLADPAAGVKARVDIRIERDGLRARGWLKVVRKSEYSYAAPVIAEHVDWATHEAAELPYVLAEEARLLYVAATRAREQLVVSRWSKKPGEGPWGSLVPFLSTAREVVVPAAVAAAPPSVPDCSQAQQDAAAVARAATQAAVSHASWEATSATADAHHIATITRTVQPSADDPSKVVLPNTPSHRSDAGQAWGALVHGLLEHAMRHANASREDLLRLGRWLTVEDSRLRDVVGLAVDTVQQVAKAGFWTEAKAAPHSVETPFAFAEAPGRVMNGVIDLMFERAGQQHVIDYKTDVDPTAYADAYARQLATYQQAIVAVGLAAGEATVHRVRADGPDVQERA